MESIREIHTAARTAGRAALSFEFFPPKTAESERVFQENTLPALLEARPDYCSVTYGAGGGTREKTLDVVEQIQKRHGLTTMMHLTCVHSTREQIRALVEEARDRGVRNFLALRGDPPGGGEYVPTQGGFEFSSQLVAFLRELGGFDIGTAGFPEGHVACKEGKLADWGYLREKVRAGADFIITQLFFDNQDFFRFRDHLTGNLGVAVPIVAGILPVISRRQTTKFVELCGAALPPHFRSRLEELGDDDSAVTAYGVEHATRQCAELLREGVEGIHFYTLNKAHSTQEVLRNLGFLDRSRRVGQSAGE